MVTYAEYLERLRRRFSAHVINSWLLEFGYTTGDEEQRLLIAASTRGERFERELTQHGKRLADRATMGAGRITGRASVIA